MNTIVNKINNYNSLKKCLMILILVVSIVLFIPVDTIATNDTNDTISMATNNISDNSTSENNTNNEESESINSTNVSISVGTEYLEYDKPSRADRIKITIIADRPGTFKYQENYYMRNISGQPKFYANQEHYKGNITDTISFNISRPTRMGEPYPFVKAIVVFNDKVMLKKKIDAYTSQELRNEQKAPKSLPGFGNILFISTLSIIYLLRKIK